MAKSDYVCKICKEVKSMGWFSTIKKYKCPTHQFICEDHVETPFFGKPICKECKNVVLQYQWNGKKGKWEQV